MDNSGDYISREAFKQEVRRLSSHLLNEWDTLGVLAAADRIPAADVRPNVTGKFYLQYNGDGCWHCSECNYQARYPSNFCPNCGADMREES